MEGARVLTCKGVKVLRLFYPLTFCVVISCEEKNISSKTLTPITQKKEIDIPDTNYFKSVSIDNSGLLSWNSSDSVDDFNIEEYRWNNWHLLDVVKNNGSSAYQYKIDTTCGLYQVRISLHNNPKIFSTTIDYDFGPKIELSQKCMSTLIMFNRPSKFQVLSKEGKIIKEGCNHKFDIDNLERGIYYLNYGNETQRFVSK